jgi:hypothetical protein
MRIKKRLNCLIIHVILCPSAVHSSLQTEESVNEFGLTFG